MSERLQIHKCSNSTTRPLISNQSKLLGKNRKPLVSQPPLVQAKLAINSPGDKHEQEADRVTEQVMRMPDPILQRKCAKCDEDEKKVLQAKEASRQVPENQNQNVPPIVHEVLQSPGEPLDPATRAFMESRFRHDFSRVRVHADSKAAESARAVNALAYTFGRDVVFGAGSYNPLAEAGRQILAHELTHILQQRDATIQQTLLLDNDKPHSSEIEAQRSQKLIMSQPFQSGAGLQPGHADPRTIHRLVRRENVSCRGTGIRNPNLTGDEAVAVIQAADTDAIELALRAELMLEAHLLLVQAGDPVDAEFDTTLLEELGLTLTNPAHFGLIRQQINRFRRVRETLESGYLRYICRGGDVSLVGCIEGTCGEDFAFSCPANRLVVLCQSFWNEPDEQSGTILHEPFHIWFDMARHAPDTLRRADASCFESFALRVAGLDAPASCVDHSNG